MVKPTKKATKKAQLKVEYVPISRLKPFKGNPRKNEAAAAEIVRSIEYYGYTNPILVRAANNEVIAGHTRLLALKKTGADKAPVIFLDMTAKQARAYGILDNKSTENTEWDVPKLSELLEQLSAGGIDLDKMGFSDEELAAMKPEPTYAPDPADDQVPEPPKKAVTKPGDLWILGDHRLLCGDCREQTINGAIIADPPYGVGYQYESWDDDDRKVNDQLYKWLNSHSVPLVYFCGSCNLLREMRRGPFKIAIWHKPWSMTRSGIGNGMHHWEPIVLRNIAKKAYLSTDMVSVSTDRVPGLRAGHPCPKPVALIAILIKGMFPDGDVTDPFLGSGTTIIAAEKLGRCCYGMEIEPKYCDVTVERWQQFTGGKAKRIKGKQSPRPKTAKKRKKR